MSQPGAANGLNCTANDIQLSSPVVTIVDACDYPGVTATLQVLVDVTNTAQSRYDIGVWLSVAWPGWSCDAQGENCTQINDGLVPTMKQLFEINPSATIVVNYPPATPGCAAFPLPQGTPPPTPAMPVPVDNALALLLKLMLMANGWYMRPAVTHKL